MINKISLPVVLFTFVLCYTPVDRFSRSNTGAKIESIQTGENNLVKVGPDGRLIYIPDENGDILPDFSRVGYYGGDREIPKIAVTKTISPSGSDNDGRIIQEAIDQLSKNEIGKDGFRGSILLKKGEYKIPGTIRISATGIVLRGEGENEKGTKLVFTANKQSPFILVSGSGNLKEVNNSRVKIIDDRVAVGANSFNVSSAKNFVAGDRIIVYRPGTDNWISDLKMDRIEAREGTKQWTASEYNLQFQRVITKVEGDKIYLDNPIVMALEKKYGGGEIFKYEFDGRINNVGIENLYMESTYASDTAEDHGWDAVSFMKIENGWIKNVTSRYFGYACVNLGGTSKNITVLNSNCYDAKSIITGSRRYSFNNDGQLNLFMNCHATEGRHDFVTGAKVAGPNVFVNCSAERTHADIGPHHRWSMGTLFDNIVSDGELNIQDRGNYGSGHGWTGVTQVAWNCTVKRAAVQSPYVSGKNYAIGLKGAKYDGRFTGRPDGVWLDKDQAAEPKSLYFAQLEDRRKRKTDK